MSNLCIGDIQTIYGVKHNIAPIVTDLWVLKALAQYEYSFGLVTWCEPTAWDLSGHTCIEESKLNTYRWGQFSSDNEIWD